MSEAPKGYTRRPDGILEPVNGYMGFRGHVSEAVMGWNKGERLLSCIHFVWRGRMSGGLCGKPAKHDPDHNGNPTKCGTHCAAAAARRKAKQEERDAAERKKWNRRMKQDELRRKAMTIVRAIADGHNDPRSICSEWVRQMDAES